MGKGPFRMAKQKPPDELLETPVVQNRIRLKNAQLDAEKALRGQLMAADRLLENKSIKELAKDYQISPAAVREGLDLAYIRGFYDQMEQKVLQDLVPVAAAVYRAHLERGNLDAARDLLFGTGVLRKDHKGAQQRVEDAAPVESIEAYRIVRQALGGSKEPS